MPGTQRPQTRGGRYSPKQTLEQSLCRYNTAGGGPLQTFSLKIMHTEIVKVRGLCIHFIDWSHIASMVYCAFCFTSTRSLLLGECSAIWNEGGIYFLSTLLRTRVLIGKICWYMRQLLCPRGIDQQSHASDCTAKQQMFLTSINTSGWVTWRFFTLT